MPSPNQAQIEALRSKANGSITNAYTTLGTSLTHPARILALTNTTDTDMLISTDGSTDMLIAPHGVTKLYDLTTNMRPTDQIFAFAVGTQFYVKYVSAPSSGSMYLEVIYGDNS